MIRADRELLADLARMNSDVVPLAMKMMDDSATVEEQRTFASRLLELGTRLNHRARQSGLVIDCDTVQEPSPQADEAPSGPQSSTHRRSARSAATRAPASSTRPPYQR